MESLHYLLMSDQSMMQRAVVAELKDTGLTKGQPKVLDYLRTHDGCIQKDLAEGCHIEAASLSILLNGMEEKGLIERRSENGNRRSLYIHLTAEGKKYSKKLDGIFEKVEDRATAGFNDDERKALRILLDRIYDNLQSEMKGDL